MTVAGVILALIGAAAIMYTIAFTRAVIRYYKLRKIMKALAEDGAVISDFIEHLEKLNVQVIQVSKEDFDSLAEVEGAEREKVLDELAKQAQEKDMGYGEEKDK